MKTISANLQSHLEQAPTTLASCWRILRTDGELFHFTDHDRDIVFNGDTYISKSGYSRTAIQSNSNFAVDNLDVDAIFDSEVISEQELRAGLFDFAEITVTLLNYQRPQDGGVTMRRGWLGEVVLQDNGIYRTELRGLTQVFSQNIVEVVTPTCRADLGDLRCGVDINDVFWAKNGTVETVASRASFTTTIDDERAVDGWFDGGLVIWLTGDNAGRQIEAQKWLEVGSVELFLPTGYPIQEGDTFTIRPGCDKLTSTCKAKFNNIINFRGEPFVPGIDKLLKPGGA